MAVVIKPFREIANADRQRIADFTVTGSQRCGKYRGRRVGKKLTDLQWLGLRIC